MARRIKYRDKETESLKKAEKLLGFGLKGRHQSRVLIRAKRSRDYFLGKHKIKSRADRLGNKVYNKYSEVFENKVAHYTSAKPKWVFGPQEESDIFSSKALNQVIGDVVWERSRWDERGEDSNLEAAHAGSCHIKAGIDDIGYPTFTVFPCESVIPDPSADNVEQLQFIAWLTVKTPEEIERDYDVKIGQRMGEYLEKVRKDYHASSENPELSYWKGINNKVENVWLLLDRDEGRKTKDELGRVTVVEIWLEDLTRDPIPFTDEEVDSEHARMAETLRLINPTADEHHIKHIKAHQQFLESLDPEVDREVYDLLSKHIVLHQDFPQVSTRLRYPDGRFITVTQGMLLRDEPNPFGIYWRDMVVKFDYLKNRNEYWGKPLGVDMLDPQDDFNHRKNMITQNINLLQNGIRKIKKGLYKKKALDFLDNLIGRTIEVNTEGDFTVDYGKPLPPDHWNDVNHIESFMDRQAGNTDVLSGRLPAPGTSGVTVDQLIQQSGVRFSLPLRHYASALQKMARIAISLMMEFLANSEVFSILGANNQIQPMEWEQLKQNLTRPDGSIKHIRIDIQSMTSSSRATDEQIALQRLQLGAYDVQAYLEKIDDPAKYQIMERLSKVNQLTQAVEGLQAQNDQLKKELNTTINRLQSQQGEGNVSRFRTQA